MDLCLLLTARKHLQQKKKKDKYKEQIAVRYEKRIKKKIRGEWREGSLPESPPHYHCDNGHDKM